MDIASGVTLAKQAYDLLKVIKEGRDAGVVVRAVGDLQGKITELQMLNAEISGLYHAEKQIAMKLAEENTKINMFALQSEKYELHTTDAGSTVYRLKTVPGSDIKPHYLCANCYHKREVSILQPTGRVMSDARSELCEQYLCPACEATYLMHKISRSPVIMPKPITGRRIM